MCVCVCDIGRCGVEKVVKGPTSNPMTCRVKAVWICGIHDESHSSRVESYYTFLCAGNLVFRWTK